MENQNSKIFESPAAATAADQQKKYFEQLIETTKFVIKNEINSTKIAETKNSARAKKIAKLEKYAEFFCGKNFLNLSDAEFLTATKILKF